MKLLFKQRMFSWFGSYDIFSENGETLFTIKGQPSWGKRLNVYDARGEHIATLKQRIITFLPCFDMYIGDRQVGSIRKDLTLFKPSFTIDCNGWCVSGSFFEWDYNIIDSAGGTVAVISKEIYHFTDTYVIDVLQENHVLGALMVTLAIDAEKSSRNNSGVSITFGG